eukprot:766933-Hanusia_phi.AAC.4
MSAADMRGSAGGSDGGGKGSMGDGSDGKRRKVTSHGLELFLSLSELHFACSIPSPLSLKVINFLSSPARTLAGPSTTFLTRDAKLSEQSVSPASACEVQSEKRR